jgi:N-methylhydantoinase A
VFGHVLPGGVEIVAVRVTARTPLSLVAGLVPAPPEKKRTSQQAPVWCFARRTPVQADVVSRGELSVRGALSGPLLVVEPTTTTYVAAGFVAETDDEGCIVLTRKD